MKPTVAAMAGLGLAGLLGAQPGEPLRIRDGALKVGDPAPDFKLPDKTGKQTIQLSSYAGKAPVVLVFASYT